MSNKGIQNFSIIGAGMVGTAMGCLLKKSGFRIVGVADKSLLARKRAKAYLGCAALRSSRHVIRQADAIIITTPDDTISAVCSEISCGRPLKGKFVIHMSGAGGLDLLDDARKQGAAVACIHPLQSFSSIDQAIQIIPGSCFGITADREALGLAKKLVRALKGVPLLIAPEQKPLYHAAACFASNYLVALMNTVESIYQSIGIPAKDAQKAYLPLVYGSLSNIEHAGATFSLTGPIARGDLGTVKKHIASIRKTTPQFSALYRVLGLTTVKIAQKKGTLKNSDAKKMNAILKGVKDEHPE
ncbi:MAG TPA: DUF2520 domain-containing protein [Smithella sp.]|nr:DUF2520 domain-containing protein [Smithella sp.]